MHQNQPNMKRRNQRLHKIFSLISGISLIFNSILPSALIPVLFTQPAYAQTETPTLDPTPTDTVTPTPDATPTIIETPTETPTPTEEVTPTIEPTTEVTPEATTTEPPHETSPPAEQGQILDGASTETPATPTPTPEEPKEQGQLSATIIENVKAISLNLDNIDPSNSATITTDKADYAPTDTAIITGNGFLPNHDYSLTVSSDDPPATSTTVTVTADTQGDFLYGYQLDGTYRPNYSVVVKDGGTIVAATTFTDSVLVAPATGGTNIPDTKAQNGSAPAFTSLGNIVITEQSNGDFADTANVVKTLVLSAPTNWRFNAGVGSVSATSGKDILGGASSPTITVTASTITVSFKVSGTTKTDTLTISGIQVQALLAATIPSTSNILRNASSTSTITGIDGTTNFGSLSQAATSTPTATPTPTPTIAPVGPISTQNTQCMGDQPTAPGNLTCTANDIQIASVDNIHITESSTDGITFTPTTSTGCDFPGQYIKFTASWHVLSTATSRYNVGLWFANQGQISAMHGYCSASTLPNSPSPFFEDTDDSCGDIHSGATGTVSPAITVVAQCNAAPGTSKLNLPYCSSWDQNESAGNACNGPAGTVPGAPSKCGCNDGFTVDITVPSSIEVVKNIVPSNDGGLFDLLINSVVKKTDATNSNSTGKVAVTTGSNTFGEANGTSTDLSNYTSTASCVLRGTQTSVPATKNGSTWTIASVADDQDILCTITNTLQTGGLTVIKHVVGGQDAASSWTMHIKQSNSDVVTPFAGAESPGTTKSLTAGTYTVSESGGPTNYSLSYSGACDANGNVTVLAGQTGTCTLTNTRDTGTLRVLKNVDLNGDGDYTGQGETGATDWKWQYNGGSDHNTGDTAITIPTGDYTLTETNKTNFHFVDLSCTGGTRTANSVAVTKDASVVCTFKNAVDLGTMTVKKVMIGGTDSFDFTGNPSGTINTNNGTITVQNVAPGSYTTTESAKSGWTLDSITCSDTNSTTDKTNRTATFNVDPGETVTCTFTNTKRGSISGHKYNDTNGNGQLDPGETGLQNWSIFIDGNSNGTKDVGEASTLSDTDGIYSFTNLTPGNYSVCEESQTDWIKTAPAACLSVTVAAGQDTSNQDFFNFQCATVSGTKWDDLNGNGVKDATEPVLPNWSIHLNGTAQSTTTDEKGDYSFKICSAGSATITETFPNNDWYQTYPGGTSPNHQVNVTSGGSYTGKDFGNAKYAKISGVKYRDNDGNGQIDGDDVTDTLAGWVFDLYDGTHTLLQTTTATVANGYYEFTGLVVDKTYYVLERLLPGWTQTVGPTPTPTPFHVQSGEQKQIDFTNFENVSIKACKVDDADGDINTTNDRTNVQGWKMKLYDDAVQVGNEQVTESDGCYTWTDLGPGNYSVTEETRTGWTNLNNNTSHGFGIIQSGDTGQSWTFVNSRLGKVIVKKAMIGGTDTFNFTGDVIGSIDIDNGTIELNNVVPGLDPVSVESPKTGWELTNLTCDDSDSLGDIPTGTVIFRVGSGETVICTFTNTKLPTLTVNKILSPVGHGGFDLKIDGTSYASNVGNGGTTGAQIVNVGSHVVSETTGNPSTVLGDYIVAYGGECDANGSVTLAAGENKTCTITNTAYGSLTIVKDAVPNSAQDFSFTTTGSGLSNFSLDDDADPTLSNTRTFLHLGLGTYGVSETAVTGWDSTSAICSDGSAVNAINIGDGENVTCTFTNTKLPTLQLVKTVDYGPAQPGDWTLTATGTNGFSDSGNSTTFHTVNRNTPYTLSESGISGWSQYDSWQCDGGSLNGNEITLSAGENVTCTVTNHRDMGSIKVNKYTDLNGDGDWNDTNEMSNSHANNLGFQWLIDGVPYDFGTTAGNQATNLPNSYHTITENIPTGYHFVSWYVTSDVGKSCTHPNGTTFPIIPTITKNDTAEITLCNARDTGTITVNKMLSPTTDPGLFNLQIDGVTTGSGTNVGDGGTTGTITVPTGIHSIGEIAGSNTTMDDYTTINSCERSNISVSTGDAIVCTFTNTRKTGDLKVHKYQDTNGDGSYDTFDSKDFSWGLASDALDTVMGDAKTLNTGMYTVYESAKDGYQFAGWYEGNPRDNRYSCEEPQFTTLPTNLAVSYDQTTEITLCNKFLNPILTITKENNTGGADMHPGDSVLYTLTVTATQSAAFNVTVTDLLPAGFTYRAGSWTGTTTEPVYHSPGVWYIGDMAKDEVVTLTYIADISGDQQAGYYHDLAWSAGCKTDNTCSDVLSGAADPGFVADNFVGTQVNVVRDTQASEGINVKHEVTGEVLGASTELPATGANALWIITAFALIGTGWILRRKYV